MSTKVLDIQAKCEQNKTPQPATATNEHRHARTWCDEVDGLVVGRRDADVLCDAVVAQVDVLAVVARGGAPALRARAEVRLDELRHVAARAAAVRRMAVAEARQAAERVARRHAKVARLADVAVLALDVLLALAHAGVGGADG